MYDEIIEDVEHVKKVLEAQGHPSVDGTLVFELLERWRVTDRVVDILLGRRRKAKTAAEDLSLPLDIVEDSSNSSNDLEVIHHKVGQQPLPRQRVDLTIDDSPADISDQENGRENINTTEEVVSLSSSSVEPLIDLTTEIQNTMEVDKTCRGNVWPSVIKNKADDVDIDNSASGTDSEPDDYYRSPPSIDSLDSEGSRESDDKVSPPPSPILRISPSFQDQGNNEASNLEQPDNRWEEMLEENNNDPNNNLEDIEVLEQNNAASARTENLNTAKEIIEERAASPKPGCSKDSYYADNDFGMTDSNDVDSEGASGRNQTFNVEETADIENLDDETVIDDKLEQDVSIIQKILPHITPSRIRSTVMDNNEAINRVAIALWKLLPEEKPASIFHPKRKQKEDNCPSAIKKSLQDDTLRYNKSNTGAVSSNYINPEGKNADCSNKIVKPAKLVIPEVKKSILKPPKLLIKNPEPVLHSVENILSDTKIPNNNSNKPLPSNLTDSKKPKLIQVTNSKFSVITNGKDVASIKLPIPAGASTASLPADDNLELQHIRVMVQNVMHRKPEAVPQKTGAIPKVLNSLVTSKELLQTKRSDASRKLGPNLTEKFKRRSEGRESITSTSSKTGAIPKQSVQTQVKVPIATNVPVADMNSKIQQLIAAKAHFKAMNLKTLNNGAVPKHSKHAPSQAPIAANIQVEGMNSKTQNTGGIPRYPQQAQAQVFNRVNNFNGGAAAGPSQNIQRPPLPVTNVAEPGPSKAPRFADELLGRYLDDFHNELMFTNKESDEISEKLGPQILDERIDDRNWQLPVLAEAEQVKRDLQHVHQPIIVVEQMREVVLPPKMERQEIPPPELFNPLINMFSNVDPNYISELCISAKARNQSLESLVEILLTNGDLRPRIYNPEPEPQDINPDSQYENLQGIFPDAQREYLRDIAEQYYNDPEAMKNFVQAKLENPDYPKMADYLKNIKITEQIKQYTDDFSAQNFLQIFPDPFKHFEDPKRVYRYNVAAFEFLKCHFNKNKVATIVKAYRSPKHPNHLTLAAKLLEAIGHDMKSRRSDKQLPTQDIPLLQEFAFIKHRAAIKEFMSAQKKAEKEEFKRLKARKELLECQCCYDAECMPSKCLSCSENHVFCLTCIKLGAASKIGEGQTRIPCFAECQAEFTLPVLQKVLEPTMFSILLRKRQEEEVKAAGLEGLVSCPFCHFASIPPPEDKVFKCLNPECMKESCRLCKELNHVPLRCDEVVKGEEARHYLEEKMTEALVRKCYRCSRPFFKDEGCNKMTCPCGATTCYICGEPVKDYTHFNGQGSARTDLCPLWSDNNVLNAQTVRVVAKAAEQEMLKKNPNLKLDATSLMPALPQASRGPHQDIANGHILPVQARRV